MKTTETNGNRQGAALVRRLETLFTAPGAKPVRERDLAKALGLGPGERGALRTALRDLQDRGIAAPSRGGRWSASSRKTAGLAEGVFRVRANGSCWLVPDSPDSPLLRIRPERTGAALNGDRVQVQPEVRSAASARMFGDAGSGRGDVRWAQVVKVLERRRTHVVGVLRTTPYYAYLVPRDPLLPANVRLEGDPAALAAHAGHLAAARLLEPEAGSEAVLRAEFTEDLGDPEDPANDIPAILLDHGRREEFPQAVVKEARRARPPRRGADGAVPRGREDLRGRTIVTIDPADAHDYDDAVSVDPLDGGGWRLGVHIADVAAYVEPGSEIDLEARRRGNSTYLPDRVIRMLPEDLTVRVCSLQPGEDHWTHSVEMDFLPDGTRTAVRTFRSVIRSAACLSYEQVQAWFDGAGPGRIPERVLPALGRLRDLARVLRDRRFAEGALDFSLPEVHVLVDAEGRTAGFEKRGSSEAYALIEECMLAANRAVAEKVFSAGLPCIYRIHEEPSDEQWARMDTELRALGQDGLRRRDARELNGIARGVVGRPEQYMVTLTLLRNMKRAVYAAECLPHFGLGFERYAHFTSPIRRYPDLLLHRILNALEERRRRPAYSADDIAALAVHCSGTERESAEMEIQAVVAKRIRWYAERLERHDVGPWPGVIVGLTPKGLIVELPDTLQQGMLPYAALGKERYCVADDQCSARGRSGGSPYRLGQPVDVILAAVDERLQRIDFALPEARPPRPPRRPRRPRRAGN
ncbi:MAG: VacB/RNase II family 3'-5' exoribonuclease [Kiritimatiellae bacterium]|nr:VacB/RNase II family 3'-5' exoribonuclease [Kiritimatiellia bacterium]